MWRIRCTFPKYAAFLHHLIAYIDIIIKAMVCVSILTTYIIKPVYVQGSSMMPMIEEGSFGISNILSRNLFELRRFDVVLIRHKDDILVKRIIALPMETISYHHDQLYINGQPFKEDFLDKTYIEAQKKRWNTTFFTQDITDYTLPKNTYYVMGDNRLDSYDSRDFGYVEQADILSKDILFPL